jgi:hypothetical protein
MQHILTVQEAIETLTELPLEDRIMVSEIIHRRAIEERRQEIADSVRISREEYSRGETEHGSVDDFLAKFDAQ